MDYIYATMHGVVCCGRASERRYWYCSGRVHAESRFALYCLLCTQVIVLYIVVVFAPPSSHGVAV